ncbi:MAG: UvrD-helicase domain-containing protein, partial [Desulfobulbales bacterium]|nr:UvrD-helicase domain-containing protein [Desulfobulbales bacterium]
PEEGKYHHDGHRKCGISLAPQETRKIDSLCPVCARPLTIGVMHRVMELADRQQPSYPSGSPRFYSLIPLAEVLSEIFSRGPATKTVMQEYAKLISMFDSEFNLLLNVPEHEISERYSPVLGEAVNRIRKEKVIRKAGFDGEFGVIKVFDAGELKKLIGQYSLFTAAGEEKKTDYSFKPSLLEFGLSRKEKKPTIAAKPLNEEQMAAVTASTRHIVVTAGPGTGKTHTLVARILRLLQEEGVNAREITAITFTNRAAEEMKERIGSLAGVDTGELFIGTFHAFCLNMLRKNNKNLTVVDEVQRDKILKRLFSSITPEDLKEIKHGIAAFYLYSATGTKQKSKQESAPRVRAYLEELEKRNGIDLAGVIPRVVFTLKNDRDTLLQTTAAVKYLFIDEFQDLNRPQYELVRILGQGSSVFAIGDPDQAIYGFRGSSAEFFHLFIAEYGAQTISLQKNYRSAKKILQAAGAVIANNHNSDPTSSVELVPVNPEPGAIELYTGPSPQAEAEFIVQRIEELMGGISHFSINSGRGYDGAGAMEISFKDFAILYRLSQQAGHLQEALERRGIPFQTVNVKPFFMHRDIRPLYYWIRAAAADREEVETDIYLQLLRTFPGVGESTLSLLENNLPFGVCADFFSRARKITLPSAVQDRAGDVEQKLLVFRGEVAAEGLPGPLLAIMEYLRVNAKSDDARRFLELAGSFGNGLNEFGAYLKKNASATVYDEKAEAVSLMTLHGAKGLEFPVVFITGMEKDVFPCELPLERENIDETGRSATAGSLEEERRLFYVGITRARDTLILTSAATRPVFGSLRNRPVSQFVREIPASLCTKTAQKGPKKKRARARQMKLF